MKNTVGGQGERGREGWGEENKKGGGGGNIVINSGPDLVPRSLAILVVNPSPID